MCIITLGNDLLRQRSESIADIDEETAALAAELLATMHIGRGIGLVAPQAGILKRIFVIQLEGDIPRVLINPTITGTSADAVSYEEGCLSVPGVYAGVDRSVSVRVQAWNEKGRPFNLDADGLLARVILHEYDHLEGTLFIDRLPEPKRDKIITLYKKRHCD
jgi:peptide deformylase